VARALVWPITAYFWCSAPRVRAVSRQFLTRALGQPASQADVFEHLRTFSNNIVDRVYFCANRFGEFDVRYSGFDEPNAILASGRGIVMLGAHLGSFEAMRACIASQPGLRAYMMMDTANSTKITSALKRLNPALADSIIDAGRPDSLIRARQCIEQGAIVGILADRPRSRDAHSAFDFLGAPMSFPHGPLLAALALRAPIYFGVALSRGGNRYELYCDRLCDGSTIPRAERPQAMLDLHRSYASKLDRYARMAPMNWFNFEDVWQIRS
jgi:predicted LPLAT superfamily acyltransferase